MKIRRFIGRDMNEAMIKVKSELGSDAVILNKRKIKQPGIFGFLKKKVVEVVAAIDEDYKIETKYSKKSKIEKKLKEEVKPKAETNHTSIDLTEEKIDKLTQLVLNLENKINQMEEKEQLITESVDKKESKFDQYIKMLVSRDIREELAVKIMKKVDQRISINSNSDLTVINAIKIVIKDILDKPVTIKSNYNEQKVFMFVGPTGVGKTTTLAKLAAKLSLRENKKVGLITSDTYRIAAVEQLRTYSDILGIPLSVIYEPVELKSAIASFDDKDYILIDTAGRNYKDNTLQEELKGMIKHIKDPEIFLVLSLVADYKNLVNVINSHDFIKDYKIIFTKFDEAVTFGNILNIKMLSNKKLSYITTGQSVPDDIEVLNTDALIDIIVGDK
ncbi:MAG TPA: flagellar biosynthesis protein FlhF [Clostridia bacterium]|nr:flagellar biosynthesis protein FlhF [Clostridia bacterium]